MAKKIFIYLARKNKGAVKLMGKAGEGECIATRIQDVKTLKLPTETQNELKKHLENNKINWDLWIESANSFQDLKNKLSKRGYTGFDITDKSVLGPEHQVIVRPEIIKTLPNQKIMMNRKSLKKL